MAVCARCRTFMFGVGMGALAGILLAPKAGKEIRRELFGGGPGLFEEPGATAMEVPESEEAEDLKAKIEETRARLKAEIEAQQ